MAPGIDPRDLAEGDLLRELGHLHATRFTTLQHGGQDALRNHTERQQALEQEYLRRYPERDVDPCAPATAHEHAAVNLLDLHH